MQNRTGVPDLSHPQSSVMHSTGRGQLVAGSSKRPASPLPDRERKKKKSVMSTSPCLVCGHSAHSVEDCPVVAEGPHRSASFSDLLNLD